MLMLTALSWALFGVAAVVAHDGALPVYFPNVEVQPAGSAVFDVGEASALLSHFRGDGQVAYSEDAERALRVVPSTFMDERNTAVLIIDNFDIEQAESYLGSPQMYLSKDSVAGGTFDAAPHHTSDIGNIDLLDHPILRVNTELNRIVPELDKISKSKVMIIGIPSVVSKPAQQRHSLVADATARNMSYINIPDFFDNAEDCAAMTNSCSGHGSCTKGSNGRYACRCKATKKNNYTYYWGGNDCSKRDVSFQANLIVGTTIAIVVASVLSIGLLLKLGSEPLPGILNTAGF